MNIKLSLTLRFLILVAMLLASFSLVIYENYSRYRQDDYFERLRERSEAVAKHIIDITDPVLLNKIFAMRGGWHVKDLPMDFSDGFLF